MSTFLGTTVADAIIAGFQSSFPMSQLHILQKLHFGTEWKPPAKARPEMLEVQQNTAVHVQVFMRDGQTGRGKSGLASSMVIQTSIGGAAFSTITPTITDLGSGWYDLALTSGMVPTLGLMMFHITSPAANMGQIDALPNDDLILRVVAVNMLDSVRAGLTSLPNATAGANAGLPVVGTQVPNATAGANNGLPIQGGAIPNAAAAAIGGLATISAVGQAPGGLMKPNSMEDNMVYTSGNLTSSRLRVFANAAALAAATPGNANGADGEVERYVSAATYNSDNTLKTFNWTKQL